MEQLMTLLSTIGAIALLAIVALFVVACWTEGRRCMRRQK